MVGTMTRRTPRYALIQGREYSLVESIPHATSGETICVFVDEGGKRRYATRAEWDAGANEFAQHAAENHLVTSDSPAVDKIAIFKSLFKGRDDVYAHGYTNKYGGIGYSPACSNERTDNCPRWTKAKRGIKCADCPDRQFTPLNDQTIIRHFKGEHADFRDVIGLYPLMQDCTTWVLVADFDKSGWQRETALYRNACRSFGLCPAVERSRSGNGAHVWLFFEEPVEAELARNLGCALITHAMSQAPGLGFEAYDRLFPTQSTIPEGGLGNLIALPLQGRARRNANSVFVNDDFEAYADQWRFLSTISKASVELVKEVVNSAVGGPLGQLGFSSSAIRARNEPMSLFSTPPSPNRTDNTSSNDFPRTIQVIRANMLFINKNGLSHKALNRIRRLAAFGNPEFYRAQAMHQSVYGKPRIIWCGEENGRHILLPRGCEQKLVRLAGEHGSTCCFEDRRNHGNLIKAEFKGTLRERQLQAADALLHHEYGVLSAPTGFGKTVIGAYLISKLKMRTLVIVPKTNLVDQWKARLEQFLDIEDDRAPTLTKSGKPSKRKRPVIGQIGAGKNKPSGIIDIATFQSLSTKNELGIQIAKPTVADYDLVICDECHYGAAPNLELVMKSVNARRVYGLSATPKRSDGLEGIIFMQCGPIRHKVDPKEQAAEQGFRRILRPQFTRVRIASLEPGSSFNQVVDALCKHDARNRLIIEDTSDAVRAGRRALVITQRKEHASALAEQLMEAGITTFLLTGEGTAREKRERINQVREASIDSYAIVATGKYIGEGFDLPQLDMLLLASPYSWEGVITQYSGRLHRESEGKSDVIVYDYVDTNVPMLERMYKKRLKTYAKLGYEIDDAPDVRGPSARIITSSIWRAEFASDLARAEKDVVIAASYANPKLVETLLPNLHETIARGIKATVVMRKPRSDRALALQPDIEAMLSSVGCETVISDAPLTGIAVFDSKIAWYGTLPLLAFAKDDDCSLRAESVEVACDLKRALDESLQTL